MRWAISRGLLAALWLSAVVHTALARDFFVDNIAGDDHWNGRAASSQGSGTGPVRTLTQALWLADSGDRISLAKTGEPYRESVTLHGDKHSGLSSDLFIIEGNGATLDGSAPVPPTAWTFDHGDVFRYRPELEAYQMLFLNGRPAKRRNVTSADGRLPNLEPLNWALARGQVFFRVEPGRIPEHYGLSYARLQTGLTLYKVQNLRINNLIVQGFALDGINLQDVAGGCAITGVTARGNGRSGIAVCGASRAVIDSCLVGDNGDSQLHLEGPSATDIENCDLIENTGPKWVAKDWARVFVNGVAP